MSIWFWIFAIMSTFSFALQWALTSKYARLGDPLTVWTYRWLSLIIIMLPLLLFANMGDILRIWEFQIYLIPAWFLAAFWVWMRYIGNQSLPVGISNMFVSLSSIITSVSIGFLFFREFLSLYVLLLIGIITIGGIIVSVGKVDFEHLRNEHFFKGIWFSLASGLCGTTSVMLMIQVSRELSPFVSGYFWEVYIGIAGLIILLLKNGIYHEKFQIISVHDFKNIFLASSPTLVWTGCLSLASLYGPVGVISAVSVLWIVFSTFLGIILFHERLKAIQYIGMGIIMLGILWIKLI